jgi:Putative Actinobacterial Holin-X, holin superfamily III
MNDHEGAADGPLPRTAGYETPRPDKLPCMEAGPAQPTPTPPPPPPPAQPRGIRASIRRVVGHARSISQLEKELATLELQEKAGKLGAGAGLGIAAAVIALYALGFALATVAAALALVVDWWLALLIVFGMLLLLTVVLALVAKTLVKKGTPLAPEQAIEEARLTQQLVRSRHGR